MKNSSPVSFPSLKAVFAWVLLALFLPSTLLLANNPPTGVVSISGTAQVGQILTVANTLADADGLGTITYQWNRDGVPILFGGALKDGVNGVDGLDGAMGVTLSADGANVYATGLNDDSVSWFDRNASTGALTYGGMLKDGVGGVDGLDGARSVTLSADGKHAYVTGWAENAVSWFERNASTGGLTYGGMLKDGVGGVDGLGYAFDVTLSAGGKHAYVTGAGDDAISWHERNATTGALTYGGMLKDGVGGVDGLNGAYGVTLSPDGKHAYVAGANDDAVSWFERNATTGALTYGGMLKDGAGGVDGLDYAFDVTVSADGKHAYVTGGFEDAVSWYERNATTGELTYGGMLKDGVGGVDGLDYAFDVTLSADGKQAYVVGAADDAISWYERNATTGALTYGGILKDGVSGVDGLDGAVRVTHSADGKYAYVTGGDDDALSWFTRNLFTGALSHGPASDANYTLTADDVGKVITVTASYVDGGTTAESVTSAGTSGVSTPPLNDSNFFTARDLWFSDQAAAFTTYGHIKDWNVTGVTNMSQAFKDKTTFDENITGWDVSNVTNMHGMFEGASLFNQPIGNWNTSAVTSMHAMFAEAAVFNQPIGNWNVSAVTSMREMFRNATSFNQPIGSWNISSVTNLQDIFKHATSFNQDIGDWNTSFVNNIRSAFHNATSFNQDIGDWNTSFVNYTRSAFHNASSFDQDLSDWNASAVTDMSLMFQNTPALSDVNKGLIHGTFSKNPNWPYDWSAHHTRPAHVVPSAANLRMLWVQPGTFTMGSPVTEAGRDPNEAEHYLTLTEGFYLGKYEVTQAQYEAVMTGNSNGLSPTPSQWPNNPNRPVEKVSWDDIQIFLARLNAAEANNLPAGWTYALPTEAQWEYACRAGTTTAYSWGNTITSANANYNSNIGQTAEVGQYAANPWGFFDMHGNVWEWTADWYQGAYPTGNPVVDPTGPPSGSSRVARGGSWFDGGTNLRSAKRTNDSGPSWVPSKRNVNLGFRLAFRQTSPPPPITNANFTTAINLWFSDEANATRTYGHIRDWNVSGVTNMAYAFKDRTAFNEDISGWDVSKVSNMRWMFAGANSFNQPIGHWKTSSVTNMKFMFSNAIAFNQPIGNWDTSSVVLMDSMFNSATAFNQPLRDWNTSAVKNMTNLFRNASAFNQPIGSWDTSSVITMDHMFNTATAFNQPIGSWNVSQVTQMGSMFKYASNFNQSIKDWDISSVTNMNGMFFSASSFDQDLSTWKFSTVAGTNAIFGNTALSDANKGKIHTAFSTNSNWRYDWSAFVTTAPPFPTADINQTDHRLDNNSTLFPPLPKTLTREELKTGQIRLWGQILASGGSSVTETAFEVADNLVFRKATLHSASLLAGSPNFYASLTLEPGKRYYYRAVASNAIGTTKGAPKKFITAGSPNRWWSESIPQGKDWRTSAWFGTFRPYDNGWIYHAKLGWAYAQPDGSGGLWLWMRDHRWTWTQKGVFPYLWKHQSASWHYLLGSQNGQPVFYEWKESAPNKLR